MVRGLPNANLVMLGFQPANSLRSTTRGPFGEAQISVGPGETKLLRFQVDVIGTKWEHNAQRGIGLLDRACQRIERAALILDPGIRCALSC